MMRHGRYILVLALAAILESGAALCGLRLPLLAVCVLYAGLRRCTMTTLPETMLTAALLDAMWCHSVPSELFSVLALALVASLWRRFGALSSWPSLTLAGGVSGMLQALVLLLCRGSMAGGWSIIALELLVGMVVTPLGLAWLDGLLRQGVFWNETGGGAVEEEAE